MEFLTLALLFFLTCLLIFYAWERVDKEHNLPPGPTPLPIIGNLLQLKSGQLVDSLEKMREKYGDVYTLYLGPRRVIVLCGYDVVKEALVDQGDSFGIRGLLPCVYPYFKGHGVVLSNGERWKQLRRFSLMTLKNFGMGKRSIEERVQEEAHYLVKAIRETNGSPFDATCLFSQVASNIICTILFGNRYAYEDPDFRRLMKINNDIFTSMSSFWGQLFDMFEVVMKYLPGPHHRTTKYLLQLEEFVKERMKNELATLDSSRPRHYIDSFLIRMQEEKQNPGSHFNLKNFYANTSNLFSAGTETLSTTLRHAFMILLKHPDIKCKVQREIDQVIGRQRAPMPEDRELMPYTDAVIHEIQRYSNVLPMNLPHAVSEDTKFRGYSIPQGTDVLPILTFVLRDPKYFLDPFTFNPDRFLDPSGCFKKNVAFMVFSAGKRVCLGEGLARLEVFIFITSLLQNFDISSPIDIKDLDISPQMVGFSNVPRPYKISFIPR